MNFTSDIVNPSVPPKSSQEEHLLHHPLEHLALGFDSIDRLQPNKRQPKPREGDKAQSGLKMDKDGSVREVEEKKKTFIRNGELIIMMIVFV